MSKKLMDRMLEMDPFSGPKCWFMTAPKQVKEFITEVMSYKAQGKKIITTNVQLILKNELKFYVAPQQIRYHLRGNCRCQRQKNSRNLF